MEDKLNVPDMNVGDMISRQAAIDAIQKLNIPEDMCVFEIISHIEVEIATLPPVQPKRGEWIPVTNGRGGHECDQCHNYAPSYQNGKEHLSDFCPHCGADMRGKADGQN